MQPLYHAPSVDIASEDFGAHGLIIAGAGVADRVATVDFYLSDSTVGWLHRDIVAVARVEGHSQICLLGCRSAAWTLRPTLDDPDPRS